jgi:hypothetical protein
MIAIKMASYLHKNKHINHFNSESSNELLHYRHLSFVIGVKNTQWDDVGKTEYLYPKE